jgi:tetratricopeptide (TPR) repeat protein
MEAGDSKGGDARGKQSAAMLVVKEGAGYGGYTDQAIDIRVDDHPEPFKELGRLLDIAQVNYTWNEAWTLFTRDKYDEALPYMEKTAKLAPENAEVLYDLAVIRLAAGKQEAALEALAGAVDLSAKLKFQAKGDDDLEALRGNPQFEKLIQ